MAKVGGQVKAPPSISVVRVPRQVRICSSPCGTMTGFTCKALLHLAPRWCYDAGLPSRVIVMARANWIFHNGSENPMVTPRKICYADRSFPFFFSFLKCCI